MKREVKVKDEEEEPIFDTHKRNRTSERRGHVPATSPNPPHVEMSTQSVASMIDELDDLNQQVDALAASHIADSTFRREPSDAMTKWWSQPPNPARDAEEEQFRKQWARDVCPSCYLMAGHSDLCGLGEMEAEREKTPILEKARSVSASPRVSFDGTPYSSPRGSPMHASVAGIVAPSSRGSPSAR